MPRDFLPALYPANGTQYESISNTKAFFNCAPILLDNGKFGINPRNEFTLSVNAAASSSDRGRGVFDLDQVTLYLDQDTYYYSGGSQDLTATTGNGYAGNTGFNEEYVASFVRHGVSGVTNLVMVNAGHTSTNASAKHGNVWYAASPTTAPSSISDAHMPGNNGVSLIRGGASLDGYFFVGDITGKIHNSDLNDITAWTETNFLTAERYPDTGMYLGRHHDNVVYIGTKSIEFFYNAGNATGSPLSRRQDVSYSIGCYYPNTITQQGDVIYFVGTDHAGWSRIYKLDRFQLTAISTPKIEDQLKAIAYTSQSITDLDPFADDVWMTYVSLHNSPGLLFSNAIAGGWYFHEQAGVWSQWAFGSSVTYPGGAGLNNWTNMVPIVGFNGVAAGGNNAGKYQFTNGVVAYEGAVGIDAIDDLGEANDPNIYNLFPRWDAGTGRKKKIISVRAITDSVADTAYAPITATLKWFDYNTINASGKPAAPGDYTSSKAIDLNLSGRRLYRQGTTVQRQYMIDWVGHGEIAPLIGLEIDYEIVGE